MSWILFRSGAAVAGAMLMAAAFTGMAAAPAYADPVPSTDEVVAIMAKLTDPGVPAANKTDIVTPGFTPDDAGAVDDHLNQMNAKGLLPLTFVVTDIEPAPDNLAGATVATTGSFNQSTPAGPIVLARQGGHWLITHDSALSALDNFWNTANRHHHFANPFIC